MAVRRTLTSEKLLPGMHESQKLLSQKQRLALARRVVVPQVLLQANDDEINTNFLSKHGIRSVNIKSAGLLPLQLKERGMRTATDLRTFGFDSIDLNDAAFCASCVSAFGAPETTLAFVISAGDAVAVAGSTAVIQLGITTEKLLGVCAGAPVQAKAVLQQLEPRGGALVCVNIITVMDTGLRSKVLQELGYSSKWIMMQTGCTTKDMERMGFKI